jgi:DNA processing protein
MCDPIEGVAWSLVWTLEAGAKPPRRRRGPPDEGSSAGQVPWGRGSPVTLESYLERAGDDHAPERARDLRHRAAAVLDEAARRGITVAALGDAAYPLALAEIPDPPPVVWVRGDLRPDEHAVALVGSRAATPHALEVAFRLASGLARAGIAIVSGLARGVDAAAHRGALDGGGRTLAVLGSGVDVIYPSEHAGLAELVAGCGAVISELIPGTRPAGWHFPRRNRIISGLVAGVVVVEASDKSGSLITAACALDQGRTVMAVPGGVLSGRNRGAHGLLRDGARIVETVDDILEELHDVGAAARLESGRADTGRPAPREPLLWAMKAGEPYDVGFLADETGLDTVRILSKLAELELGGWVARAGGGRFVRLGSNVLR